MGITWTPGTIKTTSSAQTLFDVIADEHFCTWLFLHNMENGNNYRVIVYVLDELDLTTLRSYDNVLLQNAQAKPAYYIPWIAASRYKVTIARASGPDHTIHWLRGETM